jgi:hypothetical protein
MLLSVVVRPVFLRTLADLALSRPQKPFSIVRGPFVPPRPFPSSPTPCPPQPPHSTTTQALACPRNPSHPTRVFAGTKAPSTPHPIFTCYPSLPPKGRSMQLPILTLYPTQSPTLWSAFFNLQSWVSSTARMLLNHCIGTDHCILFSHLNYSQTPKPRVACASRLNGQQTMWSLCERCGTISMVFRNATLRFEEVTKAR